MQGHRFTDMESMWSEIVVEDELIDKINEIKEQYIVPIEDIKRALAKNTHIKVKERGN